MRVLLLCAPTAALAACGRDSASSSRSPSPPAAPEPARPQPKPELISHAVALKSYGGLYLAAEGGGGGAVTADRPVKNIWETFTLESVEPPADKVEVRLKTYDGRHYL